MCANDEKPYRYRSQPLTAAIAKGLIRELARDGDPFRRQDMVKRVEKAHLSRGGRGARAGNLVSAIKKALTELKEEGVAENPSSGFWRILIQDRPHDTLVALERSADDADPAGAGQIAPEPAAEMEIGEGSSAVYVYYYSAYRWLAEERGEARWACKIGTSGTDPIERILSQAATAMPEIPRIGLSIRTSRPKFQSRNGLNAAWDLSVRDICPSICRHVCHAVYS
jgi:hypothetical protein